MPIILIGGDQAPEKRDQLAKALRGLGLTVTMAGPPVASEHWPFAADSVFLLIHAKGEGPNDPDDPITACAAQILERKGQIIHVLFHKMTIGGPCATAPCVDLIQWRGSAENAYFKELVALLRAAQENATEQAKALASPPGWLLALWQRYKMTAIFGAVATFIVLSFFNNLINAEIACSINFAQPALSDMCGYLGLGDKPKRKERIAWARVDRTDCDALQAHANAFPNGAHRAQAIDLYEAGVMEERISWYPITRETLLFEPEPERGSATEEEGLARLFERVATKAKRQCTGYTVHGTHRVVSASYRADATPCDQGTSGFFCSFEGFAVCELEWREVDEVRVCGGQ